MGNDYAGMIAGLGIGFFLVGIILYVGTIALALWIGYLIMRTAVKNGILRADAERARARGTASTYPPQPPLPQQPYPGGQPPVR